MLRIILALLVATSAFADAIVTKAPAPLLVVEDTTGGTVSNTAADNSMASVTIPAGTITATRGIRYMATGSFLQNSGASRNITDLYVQIGSTKISRTSGTISLDVQSFRRPFTMTGYVLGDGGTSAQVATGQISLYGGANSDRISGVATTLNESNVFGGRTYEDSVAEDSTGALTLDFRIDMDAADPNFNFRIDRIKVWKE